MMPRIEASEALVMAQAVALGSGTMDRAEARKTASEWSRRARGNMRADRETSWDAHAARLASMGIVVKGPKDA